MIVEKDFSARFNCRRREYKYFFPKGNLNMELLKEGAKLFVGYHDFRNFCKIDVLTTSNFKRKVLSIGIERMNFNIPLFKGTVTK